MFVNMRGDTMRILAESGVLSFEREVQSREEDLRLEINKGLINQLRKDLKYAQDDLEWIGINASLNHLSVSLIGDILTFPNLLDYLRKMQAMGMEKGIQSMAELMSSLKISEKELAIFVAALMRDCMKDPESCVQRILAAVKSSEPKNWSEANWYLDLIKETDESMAELTSTYIDKIAANSTIGRYYLFQIARMGRLESLDVYVLLLGMVESRAGNITEVIKPVLEYIEEQNFVVADQVLRILLMELTNELVVDGTLN